MAHPLILALALLVPLSWAPMGSLPKMSISTLPILTHSEPH